jgi:hypothetical protein
MAMRDINAAYAFAASHMSVCFQAGLFLPPLLDHDRARSVRAPIAQPPAGPDVALRYER